MLGKLWLERRNLRPKALSSDGEEPLGKILPKAGGSNHPRRGGRPFRTGGKMTVTVVRAAIGEAKTGGVSAGGRYIARWEPLPVEKRAECENVHG